MLGLPQLILSRLVAVEKKLSLLGGGMVGVAEWLDQLGIKPTQPYLSLSLSLAIRYRGEMEHMEYQENRENMEYRKLDNI